MQRIQLNYRTTIVLVCIFTIAGAIFADLLICKDLDCSFLCLPYTHSKYLGVYSVTKTVLYILIQRIKQILILFLIFQVFDPHMLMRILLYSFSLLIGFVCSCQFYQMGVNGVLWFFLCMFPHYILYIWGIITMYKWKVCNKYESENYIYIVLMVAFMVTGVISEAIISRFFLKIFLQYMGM